MDKEIRVYVLDCGLDMERNNFDFRELEMKGNEEAIMTEAEERGTVYSLNGFQNAINDEELDLNNSFILIK